MQQTGFTLVELLVVVMIMAVLTSIAVPQYRRSMDRSKAAEAMQMLPALFESRERWIIENQCTWSSGTISCDNGLTLTMKKLDIESKVKSGKDSTEFQTNNFKYNLVTRGTNTSLDQACVSATPLWGSNRGLTGATIWYRGDKFSCSDTDTTNHKGCDILNVVRESDITSYEDGCI